MVNFVEAKFLIHSEFPLFVNLMSTSKQYSTIVTYNRPRPLLTQAFTLELYYVKKNGT
jgi:hypothetical protein